MIKRQQWKNIGLTIVPSDSSVLMAVSFSRGSTRTRACCEYLFGSKKALPRTVAPCWRTAASSICCTRQTQQTHDDAIGSRAQKCWTKQRAILAAAMEKQTRRRKSDS